MPLANKGKGKGREVRQSRSRNTTPSSGLSASTATGASSVPGYLDSDVSQLLVPSTVQYSDILERFGGGIIPDSKSLEVLVEQLKTLSQLAEARSDACNAGMRELSQRRKEVVEDQREQELLDRDAEDRVKMKREAEDDEEGGRASKGGKLKKRKERGTLREERPLSHGAHEVTRQDGGIEGKSRQFQHSFTSSSTWHGSRRESTFLQQPHFMSIHSLLYPYPIQATTTMENVKPLEKADFTDCLCSGERKRSRETVSPSSKRTKNLASGSTSSLSPPSLASPPPAGAGEVPAACSPLSEDSSDSHQPEPAPTVPQYQVFGPNPLTFDDPTIYHIREVTPGMTDEEKKEIYCVASFPKSDLSHLMAGTPPDKDFSNSRPTNQVSANTFASYIDPYVRPLTEEDIAFLKERVSLSIFLDHIPFTLTSTREIVPHLLSCLDVERSTTLRYGRKRMVRLALISRILRGNAFH